MSDAGRSVNIAILLVYWFLVLVAVAFAVAALLEVNRLRSQKPVEMRVADRTVRLEMRELRGKRGSIPTIFAVANLRLERMDTRTVENHTEERMVTAEQVVELSFLDRWERGAIVSAVERDGKIEIDPPPMWLAGGALAIGMCLFGTFAWMAKPFAYGDPSGGNGWKFLVLALFPIGAAAYGIGMNTMKDRAEKDLQRAAVAGHGKTLLAEDLYQGLAGLGVMVDDAVRRFLHKDKFRYCEYAWDGKTLRSVSLWCQPPEGEACPGRLNPANPRDVKWGDEP